MTTGDGRPGASVSPPARAIWHAARRTWYGFTTVRTANALLVLLAVGAVAGILIPQFGTLTLADPNLYALAIERSAVRYGQPLATVFERLDFYRIFTSWWWTVLVVLFSVSLVGNTLSRLPRLLRDIRKPPVKRGRAFFRSSIPARTGPLEGYDGSVLPAVLRRAGYRVRIEQAGDTTHLVGERNRFAPLASLASHGALLLFVVGFGIVTPRFGYETALKIPVGDSRPTGFPGDPWTVLVQNEGFTARFDESGIPVDYRATLAVYRAGERIARKEVTVNDPLSVDGWSLHENFFGPAVELDVRDAKGLVLYSGTVLLDGQLAGRPEGTLRVPGTEVALELLLKKGAQGVAELSVIGVRPSPNFDTAPVILFGVVLRPGDGYFVPDSGIAIEFRRPSSYIGVIARRDPGQGFIWIGAVLLVAGVSVSLLKPRRRIWARYDATTVRLAVTGGDPFTEAECVRLVAELPEVGDHRLAPPPRQTPPAEAAAPQETNGDSGLT
ncbi:MAG: cytochrome c biogenesis protein ResB [Chloroflexota bacterium]